MPTWPLTLPTSPQHDGFRDALPSGVLRTQMDAGPPKQRRRFTAAPRPVEWPLVLTKAQTATLDTFFVTTCAMGALPFDGLTHPRTGAAITVRFIGGNPPTFQSINGELWRTTLALEVMP